MARMLIGCVLCMATLFSRAAIAQPGDRHLVMKAQVLDALFTLNVEPKPYFLKMVLRFGDTDSQMTVVVYPGRKSEMLRFRLAGLNRGDLERLVSKAVADNSQVKPGEIASTLNVDVIRSPIDYAAVNGAIEELKSIRISPVLASRVAVDQFSEYEFWYDTWQESVHYSLVGPFQSARQDELGKWMLRFRAKAEEWLKGNSGRR